jgi:hypothetical protein
MLKTLIVRMRIKFKNFILLFLWIIIKLIKLKKVIFIDLKPFNILNFILLKNLFLNIGFLSYAHIIQIF